MIKKFKVKIPALSGETERKAYVYLPAGYGADGERFPVMYMFDGHNLFYDREAAYGKSWGLSKYLDRTKTPLIIAAVECNREGNKRLEEYSPVSFVYGKGDKIRARGKKYMDWLTGEFKPYIDENYLTLPDRENTAIGGSSMGGLMALYAMAEYGAYFSKAAALSPSLWVSGGEIPPFLQRAKFGKDAVIYADYGSKELAADEKRKQVFFKTCALLAERGVNLTARIARGGDHTEASWERQVPIFMNALGFAPKK